RKASAAVRLPHRTARWPRKATTSRLGTRISLPHRFQEVNVTLKDDLIAAKALIDTPEKWIAGWLSGDYDGRYTVDQAVRAAALKSPDRLEAVHGLCSALSDALPSSFAVNKMSGLYP